LRDVAHAPAQTPPVDLAGRRVGRYRLVERIGRGGMGEVWRARDEKLARDVAVKLLVLRNPSSSESGDDARARFLREARAAAALAHPNICAVYDVDEADGVPFMAMELLGGASLRDVLARGPVALDAAREIALDVARALAAAHDAGVVHRDVKPENIRVLPDGRAKLLDFGLARVNAAASTSGDVTEAATATGVVLGTPRYMSPEQAEGKNVDARSDVFSFGVVFYEMLAGRWPWDVSSGAAVTAAILRDPPRPLPPSLSAEKAITDVVTRCLAKDPQARFANGTALAAALAATQPRALPAPSRSRTRRAASLAVVGVLALAALVALAVWSARGGQSITKLTRLRAVPSSERVTSGLALSRDGEWLATVERGIDGVVLQRVTGADRRVLPLGARVVSVAFSPDGKALLVADATGAASRIDVSSGARTKIADGADAVDEAEDGRILLSTTRELVVLDPKSGGRQAVHLGQPLAMARWSPNGASVLYTDDSPLMSAATRGRILVASGKLSERRELAPNQDNVFAWLDDHTIAYPYARGLMAVDTAQGASPRELVQFDDGEVLALASSPASRRVVLARGTRQEEVYVGALATDDERALSLASFDRLTFSAGDDYAAGWLDDDTVLLSSTRNGTYDVLAQDLGAPEPHATPVLGAPSSGEWRTQPAVGPGGVVLYWSVPAPSRPESERTKATLMMRAPGATANVVLREVTITAARQLGAVMLPDWRVGRVSCSPAACVLWRVSETRLEIEQLDVPGTTRQIAVKTVLLPAAHYGVVRLSPDGATLAAYDGGATMQIVDTETSRAEAVAVTGLGEMVFVDDDVLLLGTEGALSVLDLETREVKPLRRGPMFGRMFLSPDGERIAVTVREEKTELLLGDLE
jgi:serine/threonine protein kinase